MNVFTQKIIQIFQGSAKAFQTFPAAIASAIAFAIVTMIRIHLDWPQQEDYNFLFNCLHWAFALGAIFSLAAITAAQSRYNNAKAFLLANLLGVGVVLATFLGLYLFGAADVDFKEGARFAMVSSLAATRVSMAMLVSFLAFIILAGYPKDQSDFARSFFMTQKAFFLALIYGAVIMSGASGVAGAIQALLYRNMSEKVYMYIATLSGFLAFTIFVGYFPDFRKGQMDKHREVAQKQPRFIEILFEYIMIPIVLALTAVLLIWAGKTVVTGTWPVFVRLSSIATGYAIGGIWLHVLVTHHKSGLAKFYRRFYPLAALVILAFQGWAVINQLGKSGLKITEYNFILIWIVAVVAAILLLIMQAKAHEIIVALTCAMAIFSVLPVVGYHALPVTAQVSRLENLLVSQGMLRGDELIPAAAEPELAVRESITDAVTFLAYAENAKLPGWFDKKLGENDVFETKLGFAQTWPQPDSEPGGYMGTYLMLPAGSIDISDYRWAVNLQPEKDRASVTINGDKGLYRINWTLNPPHGTPNLKILLDNRVILNQNLNTYIDRITATYPPGHADTRATLKDMSLRLETPEVVVLLVFDSININVDPQKDIIDYWIDLSALYLQEKP